MLLVALVVFPLAGALLIPIFQNRRFNVSFLVTALLLVMASLGLKDVFLGEALVYQIPLPGPFAPLFRADALSAIFVLLALALWFAVSLYAPDYMQHEGRAQKFEAITLLTLTAVLGIFLAGDLVTMLLFFELMTIFSFFWVVHRWDQNAFRAGYFYLFFSIVGGLFIALGIVFLGAGTNILPTLGGGAVVPQKATFFTASLALLSTGFGIKAGMAPLHLWLPYAHSAAPTPGSALLSGLLIKVGAYGLIRTGEFAGWGGQLASGAVWLGPLLTILGITTMLVGVLAALLQGDAKRLLAYHSVSQMGYVILGLGLGLYLAPHGSLGLMGSIYHIVNHALFKGALFLGVGIIYLHTKETDLYKLGGLWRRFPVTAFFMFLAVLGITGAPGLNGYASKSLLHHAVDQAAAAGTLWSVWLARLFSLVGVGTAASFTKLFYLTFLGKPTKLEISGARAPKLRLALGFLALLLLAIGLNPQFFPTVLGAPALRFLGASEAALEGLAFWGRADVVSSLITLALGIVVFFAGLKSGVFHWQPPLWLSLEGLGQAAYFKTVILWQWGLEAFAWLGRAGQDLKRVCRQRLASLYGRLLQPAHEGGRVVLTWISIDAAVLIAALALLIVWYTVSHPRLLPSLFP